MKGVSLGKVTYLGKEYTIFHTPALLLHGNFLLQSLKNGSKTKAKRVRDTMKRPLLLGLPCQTTIGLSQGQDIALSTGVRGSVRLRIHH